MYHVAYFLVYNVLAKFQLFCIITCRNILYFVFWLPYCHTLWHHQYLICIIQKLWISLERYEIWQKWKHHSSWLLKAFQIHLFFNTSIFHFIGTLKRVNIALFISSFKQKVQDKILQLPQNWWKILRVYMVLGDAFSKLETFVWILNRISRSITWSLFTLKATYLV